MDQGVNKANVLLAGVTTAVMAAAVVGHMYVIDWFGRKLQKMVRAA